MRDAILIIARLTNVKISEAVKTIRRNPLLGDEIGIKEELINLEEVIDSYHLAHTSLKEYPKVARFVQRERRQIVTHCIGLLLRMMRGNTVTYDYSSKDLTATTKKLIRLIIKDAEELDYMSNIGDSALKVLLPYMSLTQYMRHSKRAMVNPLTYVLPLMPMPLRHRYA